MLKTLNTKSAKSNNSKVGVGDDNKARYNSRCKLNKSEIGDGKVDSGEVDDEVDDKVDDEVGKNQKTSKSKKLSKSKKTVGLDFFILRARLAFIKLR